MFAMLFLPNNPPPTHTSSIDNEQHSKESEKDAYPNQRTLLITKETACATTAQSHRDKNNVKYSLNITPGLTKLHWLSASSRITLFIKALQNCAESYGKASSCYYASNM